MGYEKMRKTILSGVLLSFVIGSAFSFGATYPERIIGYRDNGTGNPSLWYPYLRDTVDWNQGIDNLQLSQFGWSGSSIQVYLADINGDGLDDKVLSQIAGAAPTHQYVWVATTEGNFGDDTWANPSTDWEWWNTAFIIVFGDIDGDGIDDNGATASGTQSGFGGAADLMWSAFMSEGTTGISKNQGGLSNFTGWNTFGVYGTEIPSLGDMNGDGVDDRILFNPVTFQVSVDYSLSGGGYGNSITDATTTIGGVSGDQLAISDINGDGIDDLVIVRENTAGGNDYYDVFGWYTSVDGTLGSGLPDIQDVAGVVSLADDILFGQINLPLDGDADLDGDVDIDDLALVASNWLSLNCDLSNQYCNWTDFPSSRDGKVDLVDYGLLAGNWQVGVPVTYFVSSSTGNDLNDGLSEATAWQSFNHVNALTLQPGEIIKLKRGDIWTQELRLQGVGTSEKPIEITAYGTGAKPIISRTDLAYDFCCVIEEGSYWNINNLDFRNAKLGLYFRYLYTNNNREMTVTDCHFQGMTDPTLDPSLHNYELAWSCGIWVGGKTNTNDPVQSSTPILDGMTVRNCTFQDCVTGISNNWYYVPTGYSRDLLTNFLIEDCQQWGFSLNGIIALNRASNGTCRRLRVLDGGGGSASSGTTAAFLQACQDLTIDDCEFSYFDRVASADGTGFDFEGYCENIIFTNNVIHNNDGAAILWLSTELPNVNVTMQDCVFFNNSLDAWGSPGQNDYELKSAGGLLGTGVVQNCGIYRSSVESGWFSSDWDNVSKINNRELFYSSVSGRPTAWEFNNDGDLEGWNSFNDWTSNTVSSGVLWGLSGIDPYSHSSLTWANTHRLPFIRIRMQQTAGSNAQIFFIRETDGTWDQDKSVVFPINADGQFNEYVIDMRSNCPDYYKGVVTGIRLDPTDASGSSMAIDYVRFSTN
jgi:hypothetical protein